MLFRFPLGEIQPNQSHLYQGATSIYGVVVVLLKRICSGCTRYGGDINGKSVGDPFRIFSRKFIHNNVGNVDLQDYWW